jgi:hypothetical protein
VPQLIGKDVPQALLINSNDFGFGVFIIDEKSGQYFEGNLSHITN